MDGICVTREDERSGYDPRAELAPWDGSTDRRRVEWKPMSRGAGGLAFFKDVSCPASRQQSKGDGEAYPAAQQYVLRRGVSYLARLLTRRSRSITPKQPVNVEFLLTSNFYSRRAIIF